MKGSDRVQKLLAVGQKIKESYDILEPFILRSQYENPWFLPEYYAKALNELTDSYLSITSLDSLKSNYQLPQSHSSRLGIIMAGNIPLVGVQDVIHGYLSGYSCVLKLSTKDRYVWPELLNLWTEVDSDNGIEIKDKLTDVDYVIATGSDNSISTLQNYFKGTPGVFRGHRNSVAVLTGDESKEELTALNEDVFAYFGLGCRNISKMYLPDQYDFASLIDALKPSELIRNHSKFINNYEYNYALLVMNQVPHVTNGHLLMYENPTLHSRVGTVHFEYYSSEKHLYELLLRDKDSIQCIVTSKELADFKTVPLGQAQSPSLLEFADNIDTMKTLIDWIDE